MITAEAIPVTDEVTEVISEGSVAPPPNSVYGRSQALLFNLGPATIYLGGPGVTPANGFPVGQSVGINLAPFGKNDIVYGVCAAGQTAEVRVLRQDHNIGY